MGEAGGRTGRIAGASSVCRGGLGGLKSKHEPWGEGGWGMNRACRERLMVSAGGW